MPSTTVRAAITWLLCVLLAVVFGAAPAGAQYFGRNKVQYRTFAFQILRTDHFDLYYYPEEAEAAVLVSRMAERWHARLSRFFAHDLRGRQVVILYAAGAHFRQTNAIEGLIGEGTGGVTEGFRRRIALPVSGSLADTDHVLGHELVHAFQFDLTGDDPHENPGSLPGILTFPLWFVEGMAEYLTLGGVDSQTAMWMRDAALHERLPSIQDLDSPDYFPYRWGHAFWAYVGARYGDRTVASLIRSAANPRVDLDGLARQLGTDPDTLTAEWHAAILASTRAVTDRVPSVASVPRVVVEPAAGGGRYNVGPQVSPDGRRVVFFSERDLFSVDLYLADVETGQVERRLLTTAADPHFDSLQFLHSAGAWSPDGRWFAVTAIRRGRPVVAILDVDRGRVARELPLAGLDDAINPAYSPDGRSIALSGNVGGLVDLYRLSLETEIVERVTADAFADLEPTFTPDGASLVFVTERFSSSFDRLEPGSLQLARVDLATGRVRPIPAFPDGRQLSPQVSADGRTVTFVADPDGVSNLYRMPLAGGPVERLSSLVTGVAGITASSPALSASRTGRLVFSVFDDGGHAIYRLDPDDTVALVPPEAGRAAAVLPGRSVAGGDVQSLLADTTRGLPPGGHVQAVEPYRDGLALEAVGQPTVSGTVSALGTRVTGGMSASFSDMLGDRGLGFQVQIGGSFADLGGEVVYFARKHRWNWAVSAVAAPRAAGYVIRTTDPATGETRLSEIIDRQPVRGLFGTAAYPFDVSTRVEVSGGVESRSFTRELRVGRYDPVTRRVLEVTRETIAVGDPLRLATGGVALVRDTARFGATGPIFGSRTRVELGHTAGTAAFTSLLADWRQYLMPVRPVTIAVRGLHYGRYGRDAEHDQLLDLYVGHPEFVRGYGLGSFTAAECLRPGAGGECAVFDRLIGSRMLVANVEIRTPLRGLFTGALDYGRLPIDVVGFLDAGLAWRSHDQPTFAGGSRRVVRSVGAAVRANIFGFLVLEVAASRPLDRVDRSVQWQVGIREGF